MSSSDVDVLVVLAGGQGRHPGGGGREGGDGERRVGERGSGSH